jgi:oxygen-dependent protoporphyrinogen oxidase
VQGEAFEAVVLALPAAPAAKLSRPFAPQLADALAEFHTAPVTLVHLGLPEEEVPRGFGMLDGDGALHALGALFPSSMLPGRAPEGRALVTAICGGALHPERAALPDQELISFVRADLLSTLGVRSEPDYVRVVRHPAAIPQYATGHRDRVRAARLLLANLPRIELAGASYDGVSVPDVARSGAAAAARLLAGR